GGHGAAQAGERLDGDHARADVGAPSREGDGAPPLPGQGARGPPAHHRGRGTARHPVHHQHPRRHRRDRRGARRRAARHPRGAPPPPPRPGGHRPELPGEAAHGELAARTAEHGLRLRERLCLYPEYATRPDPYLATRMRRPVSAMLGDDGLAVEGARAEPQPWQDPDVEWKPRRTALTYAKA